MPPLSSRPDYGGPWRRKCGVRQSVAANPLRRVGGHHSLMIWLLGRNLIALNTADIDLHLLAPYIKNVLS